MSTTSMSTTSTTTPLPYTRAPRALLPDALRLGAVRLAVTDLDRAVDFYTGVVGLTVAGRGHEGAHQVAHLDTGGASDAGGEDVVVLQEEPGARPAGKHARHAGLYHVALNYPTRLELARALRRIAESRTPIQGASDHATHEAIYLPDPDGNGLELAWDRPREQWP
ncbi:MAG TPA: VOC family protein, partial [Thermoleophilaceae bacterium]|nr:VOC family protein [Thermoleophilaceae bacterium]